MKGEEEFIKADEAWDNGQLKKAFDLFMKGALLGDSSCQGNLGVFFECGLSGRKNLKKALYWYRKAIKNDNCLTAMCNLADLYRKRKNIRRAKYWYQRAIKSGDKGGPHLELAKIYLEEKKNKHNLSMAKSYLRKALKCSPYETISQDDFDEAEELMSKHFPEIG